MIIPIRCMGCGKLIADKWRYYQKELEAGGISKDETKKFIDGTGVIKTPEGDILNKLGLTKLCCRIHFLTHRDLIDKI